MDFLLQSIKKTNTDMDLSLLTEEQYIAYVLKYALPLDDEVLTKIMLLLNYNDATFVDMLTNEEKFYIRLRSKHKLKKGDIKFREFDEDALEKSISSKLLEEREKMNTPEYNDKKGIYFKLLYRETMSSKEVALILGRTAKQVDKLIENGKNKLKKQR